MNRRTGRPPIDPHDKSVQVGVSLPARQFDVYAKRALAADVSVPEIIRRVLRRETENEGKQSR